jgi:purine-binding chemotaxis protein CheW
MNSIHSRIDWNGVRSRLAGFLVCAGNDSAGDADRMNEALHQRALKLAGRRKNVDSENRTRFLTFRAGSQRIGIGLASVKQVFPPVPITPVPGRDKMLLGIAHLNGSLHSIVDSRVLFNMPAAESDGGYVILLQDGGKLLGVWTEAIDGVAQIDPERLTSADIAASDSTGRMIMGVSEDRILVVDGRILVECVSQRSASRCRQ